MSNSNKSPSTASRDRLSACLDALGSGVLSNLNCGVEKESLRITSDGSLSTLPHPPALGSAMTHPFITTDFSEAQLELVTGVHQSTQDCLTQLQQIHQFTYANIGDELLWATSMPCRLPVDDEIPIGQFGSSNIGRSKTVYRHGLSHRYGRRMQTISGVHYNFSMPETAWPLLQKLDNNENSIQDYQNAGYFSLIRNFKRHSWLLLYLFGASPAVCGSFVAGRSHRLEPIGDGSMYLPYGTSMRMGPLGYQSDAQKSLAVSFNDLSGYAASLSKALTQPYPPYVDIGILEDGEYRQLNTTLLQIENEFYGTIRPKRRIRPGERALRALDARGVEYVEVRCLDIDPFSPIGIGAHTARLVDVFLLHCLLTDSPPDSPESLTIDARNQLAVAERGRAPGLSLTKADGTNIGLADWGHQLLSECTSIAAALDAANNTELYSAALDQGHQALDNAQLTPSAQVLSEMARNWSNSYQKFALNQSVQHRRDILSLPLGNQLVEEFMALARQSIDDQIQLEQSDSIDFETYRQKYVSQDLACTG